VDVLGSTVLWDQIAALTKSFENREVTFEDLIGLRSALLSSTLKTATSLPLAHLLNNQALLR